MSPHGSKVYLCLFPCLAGSTRERIDSSRQVRVMEGLLLPIRPIVAASSLVHLR